MSASPVPPAPPRPPQWQPPMPPQKSNNAIWWILGIIGACILLVVIAGLFMVAAIVHRMHVNTANNRVEIQTPIGNLKVNPESEHATGLPVYPGATLEKSQGASLEVSDAHGKSAGLSVEKYDSDDSREKVQEWYSKHLGAEFKMTVAKSDGGSGHDQIPGVPVNVDTTDVAFTHERPDGTSVVALGRKGEGTEITLVRVGKKEPQ
jgi:hypothetical protein